MLKGASAFSRQPSALRYLTFFLALAVAWTWPVAARISWRIPHDPGDPLLNAWILWWNTQAVPFTDAWWNAPIFYPMPGAFALSEHLAGIALFTAPLHGAGLNPLAAYNVALILCCWLSGYFAFLLGRRLTGSAAAGLVAGIAFGIAPYRASQLSHLQVLTAQWMPLALLAMHAYLDEGRRRWLVLFAAAWLVQALSNGYYLLFFPVLVGLWLLWFVDWRRGWRRGIALAGAFAASSLLLVPALLRYKGIHDDLGLQRSFGEMRQFSARLDSFVQPAHLLTFWPTLAAETQEGFLFPGVTVIVLALLGAAALLGRRQMRRAIAQRSPALFYALAAVVLWSLCFGPAEEGSGAALLLRPYTLLTWLPGFDALRVPARFGMVATLCISIAAALAAARLAPAGTVRRVLAASLVALGLFVDGWIDSMPIAPAPQRVMIDAPAGAVVLELPADEPSVSLGAMYRAIGHGRPVVNGYSGHTPPHYGLLSYALRLRDPSILTHFAQGHPLVVVVHRRHDTGGEWRELVREAGGVLQEESGVGSVFLVPPQPRERVPPVGPVLPLTRVRSPAAYATVDLGAEQVVRSVTIALRWRYAEVGPRMAIETSNDGLAWTSVWESWTGNAALTAALQDQRVVPMTIYLPDVRARYLRLSPVPLWVEREISVRGPG
ncbi:MAG TPA: hypothetical protein VJ813_18415 [Vicinamibacterales bacterium]|nr:hypothetical protein [Vicinamibacterales bacterium]